MGVARIRFAAAAVVIGLVLALVLGAVGLLGGGRALGAATTLTILSGEVSVRHGIGSPYVTGIDGEVLRSGDGVRTALDARAVLTYFEGSTVTIEPGTDLAIDDAMPVPGGSSVVMTQIAGRTWHVVTKLVGGSSKYEVRTPASTASVRGTAFEVDTAGARTTIITTQGTVVSQVLDPAQPGKTVEVPVTAGNAQTQERSAPPAQATPAPPPERKVTITVDASNSLVVDPLGRANGVTKDGKVVTQTPGARVKVVGGTVVIELPDVPDGKIAARVDKGKDGSSTSDEVRVRAVVEEKGKADVVVESVKREPDQTAATGFEIKKGSDGETKGRALGADEVKTLPGPKTGDQSGSGGGQDNARPIDSPRVASPAPVQLTPTEKPKDERRDETARPSPTSEVKATPEPSPGGAFVPPQVPLSLPPVAPPPAPPNQPRSEPPRSEPPKNEAPKSAPPRNEPPRGGQSQPPGSGGFVPPQLPLNIPTAAPPPPPQSEPPKNEPKHDPPKSEPKNDKGSSPPRRGG